MQHRRRTDAHALDARPGAVIEIEGERIFLAKPIAFVGNSAEIAPTSVPALKGVAELLKNNHFLKKVMIESYVTEAALAESIKLREELAFARAQAVKDFLVSAGVTADRLIAVGYGDIDQFKARKNFIEFHVIQIDRSMPG